MLQPVHWIAGGKIKYDRAHPMPNVDDPSPEIALYVCDECGSVVAADHEWPHMAMHEQQDSMLDRVSDLEG